MKSLIWSLWVQWWAQGDNRRIGISLKQFHWGTLLPTMAFQHWALQMVLQMIFPGFPVGPFSMLLGHEPQPTLWVKTICTSLRGGVLQSAKPFKRVKLWGLSFWYRKVSLDQVAWTCKYISDATIKMPACKIIFQQNLFQKTFWRLYFGVLSHSMQITRNKSPKDDTYIFSLDKFQKTRNQNLISWKLSWNAR